MPSDHFPTGIMNTVKRPESPRRRSWESPADLRGNNCDFSGAAWLIISGLYSTQAAMPHRHLVPHLYPGVGMNITYHLRETISSVIVHVEKA